MLAGKAGCRKLQDDAGGCRVKCVKCEQNFAVMIPDAIIAGPFLPLKLLR
jgi:hypothetical protein